MAIQVILPRHCVASTKPEAALARGQGWMPWQCEGGLWRRVIAAEAGMYSLEGH